MAVLDGRVIGTVTYGRSDDGIGDIGVFVADEFDGTGVGDALLASLIAATREPLEVAIFAGNPSLGIPKRVDVVVRSFGWRSGRYVGIRRGRHRISIASYLSARDASRALWHELTHALQAECLGSHEAFEAQWWAEMRALGLSHQEALHATGRRYRRAPLEAEATANERRHRDLALAYPRRRPSRLIAVRRALGR